MQRKLKNIFQESFACSLFQSRPLPMQPWAQEVVTHQAFGYAANYRGVNWSHLGLMESVLVVSGVMKMVGIESDKVPGATFKDKRKFLFNNTIDVIKPLVENSGFLLTMKPGILYTLPTGFVRIIATSVGESCKGVRWSMSSDEADDARVMIALRGLIESLS